MSTAQPIDLSQPVDLNKKYTKEERDALFDSYFAALHNEDRETIDYLLSGVLPIHPRWAKIIAKVMGKQYLVEHFNLSYANDVFGEGWLDDE